MVFPPSPHDPIIRALGGNMVVGKSGRWERQVGEGDPTEGRVSTSSRILLFPDPITT
jgi:hypothetical protein